MKQTDRFADYIESKQKTIAQIKCNRNFTDQEKEKLIATYNVDIQQLNRLQAAIYHRELRRTKQQQFIKLLNYETL